jgi:hypothetical protein
MTTLEWAIAVIILRHTAHRISYLSPQGFLPLSQVGLRVACGAGRDRLLVTDVWMPSEAWRARSAMAVL